LRQRSPGVGDRAVGEGTPTNLAEGAVLTRLIARVASTAHGRFIFGRRVRRLAAHVSAVIPIGARTVIDVGCGDGSIALEVLRRRPELEIRGLETRARPQSGIPTREYDGASVPFDDASQDVVLLVDVLHHAEDPFRLLSEAARVARRAVVIKDHFADPWLGGRRLAIMDWAGNVGHGVPLLNRYWSRTEWQRILDEAGLQVHEQHERLGLYPLPLRWLFETGLHFVVCLTPRRERR
jgi:SAM-dependent methyltransferase